MKILIIRLSAMGDVAMSAPIVASLRKDYPQAEITILTRGLFRSFFSDIEGLHFADFDPNGRHKGLLGLYRLSRELGSFDYVADMHDILRTKILRNMLLFSGAKIKHIDKGRAGKRELTRRTNKRLVQLKPTVERYHNVLSKLGLEPSIPTPRARDPRTLSAKATLLCANCRIEQKWIGIAPFAQHKGKIYPIEKMFEVVRMLSEQGHNIFIFGGGDSEKAIAQDWQSRLKNTVSVIGVLSLVEEIELISNLDTIICMDSSSMHMASLVGVDAVSIWGATHPYAGFMGFGQSDNNAVQLDLPCRPCSIYGNKPCLHGDYHCMCDIEPQTIVEKVNEVVNAQSI